MSPRFVEVADGVHVLRHPALDINVTLIVGTGSALLVDTLSTLAQAQQLKEAVQAITPHPWQVINTHYHFDHCFGNAVLATHPPCRIYAHEMTAGLLRDQPDDLRRRAHDEMLHEDAPLAAELARTPLLPPTDTVHSQAVLDVGGRRVVLRHPGRGHTAGDLVVHIPDVDVLVAGDLIEEGGPPAFEDSFPLQWPESVAELIRLISPSTVVVPGHGSPVDAEFVRVQHQQLVDLTWLIRAGHAGQAPPERVAASAPFGARPGLIAARRGYAELDGTA